MYCKVKRPNVPQKKTDMKKKKINNLLERERERQREREREREQEEGCKTEGGRVEKKAKEKQDLKGRQPLLAFCEAFTAKLV